VNMRGCAHVEIKPLDFDLKWGENSWARSKSVRFSHSSLIPDPREDWCHPSSTADPSAWIRSPPRPVLPRVLSSLRDPTFFYFSSAIAALLLSPEIVRARACDGRSFVEIAIATRRRAYRRDLHCVSYEGACESLSLLANFAYRMLCTLSTASLCTSVIN
jgi:hypothetical protein